jgi:hypothetical protein
MRNKTLDQRLMAIEAEFDRATKATQGGQQHISRLGSGTSAEEAARFYEDFKESAKQPHPNELDQMNAHQLIALYQRMVRGPTTLAVAKRSSSTRSRVRG